MYGSSIDQKKNRVVWKGKKNKKKEKKMKDKEDRPQTVLYKGLPSAHLLSDKRKKQETKRNRREELKVK